MLGLRLFGVALMVIGVLFVGPLSTRGPAFRLKTVSRRHPPLGTVIDGFLTFRKWWVRLIGLLAIVGGAIYVVHPPAHLY